MRLIDADNLTELCDIMADKFEGIGEGIWHQFRATVEWCPTIEANPVRHGRWDRDMGGVWCSVCGEYSEGEWDYCPYCGAKMDGSEGEVTK